MMSKQESIANILKKLKEDRPESFRNYSPAILRLHRIHDYLNQDLLQIIEKYHLQRADFSVLATLRRGGKPYCLSPTALYCSMLFSSGGLTKVLNRITKAELVARIDNPEDKRSKLVKLTETGKVLIDEVLREVHRSDQKNMTTLSNKEQEQLDMLLEKFLSSWE